MATIDVSSNRAYLLSDEQLMTHLPPEILQVIRSHDPTNFLDAVAATALIPQYTSQVFVYFEEVFADICARWVLKPRLEGQEDQIINAFARILPFAPYLSVFLEQYLSETSVAPTEPGSRPFRVNSLNLPSITKSPASTLTPALIAVWRLLNFDKKAYRQIVEPSWMQMLFNHPEPPVRYLAIRIFCILMSASDSRLEALIQQHILRIEGGSDSISSPERQMPLDDDFDGQKLDLTFLSLCEKQRAREIENLRKELKDIPDVQTDRFPPLNLTPLVVRYGATLLPRPQGSPQTPSSLVLTETAMANLECLTQSLHEFGPVMLHGLAGSGKTSAVHELARELEMESSMVTLHLNEQTDAKMLIGLYSTDSKPGSFSWRPGVLTTAVREGRWVLIEDLDRAPNEVMSTLLPLVERGELVIPSRGETIRAPSGFRLFATVRTIKGMYGQESLPTLLGQRFWHSVAIRMPQPSELQEMVLGTYPLLRLYAPMIISVYNRLCALPTRASGGGRTVADRPVTPRDLLKWCRRLSQLLVASGCRTGKESISDETKYSMFMEAADCFCGSIPSLEAKAVIVSSIAEEMHVAPQMREHYVQAHIPRFEETLRDIKVGRVSLTKRPRANRITKVKKTFANTNHAKRVLEQIAVAVKLREPTLLVGETGIGKTTVVQQLADLLGHKLVAVNLSQQSEVGDLLGGFKPVNVRTLAVPLKEEFEDLFATTGISATKNQKYLEQIGKFIAKGQWPKVLKLWREAPKMFSKILAELQTRSAQANDNPPAEDGPVAKRRKTESKLQSLLNLQPRWDSFSRALDQFAIQISGGSGTFAFAFVEGNIVKAARNGDWVLLDEINLASPDTLESIADLLASGPNDEPSLLLSETGEIERVVAHPEFRIFGAMNPATDIGKRDLPLGLRSRFTELYVSSPDKDLKDLLTIIKAYLKSNSSKDEQAADDIARLYLKTKALADEKRLVDGANEVPHFSLRTLTRVLTYVNDIAPMYGLRRALYEGFSMGFLTLLSKQSEDILVPEIRLHLLENRGNPKSLLSQQPKHPGDNKQYVRFQNKNKDRHYWLLQGEEVPREREDYIITPSVERNLLNLVRATSTRRFPVLIQGPTSAGKTSMIEFLANYSGNKFVRINNHEHTDLQEYLGTYVSGADGKLHFQEGLLVQALRQGHWIVLDELNLAPTDVLEALNRLLDDNRELLIPETQEVVRPHENFMLFATQNPPGLYGGRKVLSRAFRNRFLELHYDDIPEDELETILQKRSVHTAPSDCKRIVQVYKELSRLRQTNRLFENKDSFATLRDLFRWALRGANTRVPTLPGATPREEMANQGFMLLAERVRNEEERIAVKDVIETVFHNNKNSDGSMKKDKPSIEPQLLYSARRSPFLTQLQSVENAQGVVWTQAMRRLYVLVAQALSNNEPVLLVGETGCGKTTVCQLLAEALGKELHIVNAHQNTETGDLIGSQRPVRNRGAIADTLRQDLLQVLQTLGLEVRDDLDELLQQYHALEKGQLESIPEDMRQKIESAEIKSKALFEWADGSLVHAMRSGQYFLLDEISLADDSVLERLNSVLEPSRTLLLAEKGIENSFVEATEGFQFFATMNPGGDFGKKELSPALRNRFTEIWVPGLSADGDVLQIVSSKLKPKLQRYAESIVKFSYWFGQQFRSTSTAAFSIRDILVWARFINESTHINSDSAVIHGAATVFIDTLGANPSALIAMDPKSMDGQRQQCLDKLSELLRCDATKIYRAPLELSIEAGKLAIGDFSIARAANDDFETGFALHAPTTKLNAMRVIRALQVQKPILLEGSPGVGKTTLVSALARACGQPLTRINLSDQTDLMDLFGTDVPVEGAEAGHFAWRDAPFLRAMQNGEWVLLDEMNLASQSVLEGLNACLDHRGEVYISELDQSFKRHPNFRLFAAQNPHHQGGGRKGLPSSFVNRFIVVYADVFTETDLLMIAQHNFPNVPAETVKNLISFISSLDEEVVVRRSFGASGAPWEFNLRDTLRWLQLLTSQDPLLATAKVDDFLDIVIRQRFRGVHDRQFVNKLFANAFQSAPKDHQLYHNRNSAILQTGLALLQRDPLVQLQASPYIDEVVRLHEIESLLICIKQNLPCILAGPSGSVGKPLVVFPMNADVDAMDLVGGFEQHDPLREVNQTLKELEQVVRESVLKMVPQTSPQAAVDLLNALESRDERADASEYLTSKLQSLRGQTQSGTPLADLVNKAHSLLSQENGIRDPTFEWLDGIIVKALQKGEWLVLDNANLCSASVLDRLNSLLEPNGFLIINEHCGPNGEPRIIEPHPDFRVFLTMDPRYGELSRAMRNRAIEIYLDHVNVNTPAHVHRMAQVESSLGRFETLDSALLLDASENELPFGQVAADSLSKADMALYEQYRAVAKAKILPRDSDVVSSYSERIHTTYDHRLEPLEQFMASDSLVTIELDTAIQKLHGSLDASISMGFESIQPRHPLQNSTIVPLLQGSDKGLPIWLGICYEVSLNLVRAQKHLRDQEVQAQGRQPSLLNRLQRSSLSGSIAAVSKDSTVGAYKFLSGTLQAVEAFLCGQIANAGPWQQRAHALGGIMLYWWRTLHLLSAQTATFEKFDEARFQAHLGQGADMLAKYTNQAQDSLMHELLVYLVRGLNESFVTGFKLSTGLSMEPLWKAYRPLPITNANTSELVQRIESLAPKFDKVKWNTRASAKNLSQIMTSLVQVYGIVRNDEPNCGDLVTSLDSEIEKLAAQVDEKEYIPPNLTKEFEYLRQLIVLESLVAQKALPAVDETVVLSDLPILAQMRLQSATPTSKPLQLIGYLMGTKAARPIAEDKQFELAHPWAESLSANIASKLANIDSTTLQSLSMLEAELPVLAHQISKYSGSVTGDSLEKLGDVLLMLMRSTVTTLGPDFAAAFDALQRELTEDLQEAQVGFDEKGLHYESLRSMQIYGDNGHLPHMVSQHFVPSLISLFAAKRDDRTKRALLANAWLQFSLALIKLYIPDKMFDPQLRPLVDLESYEEHIGSLSAQLSYVKRFEVFFTGQPNNLRGQLVEDEIRVLGDKPSLSETIYRSPSSDDQTSEHRAIQGEFNGVLKAVLGADILSALSQHCFGSEVATQQLQVIRQNVAQIVARLTLPKSNHYEDLSMPAINILHCLDIGLSLGEGSPLMGHTTDSISKSLSQCVPFMNGSLAGFSKEGAKPKGMDLLRYAATCVAVEGPDALSSSLRDAVFEAVHSFYGQWSLKLESDRKAEEEKRSLYRFKGSFEDEEAAEQAAFDELFPTFDAEGEPNGEPKPAPVRDSRGLAIELAKLHRNIFLTPLAPSESIKSLWDSALRQASRDQASGLSDRTLLSPTLQILHDKMADYNANETRPNYNFYTTENLPEARKLVSLVNDTRARFRQLQKVDEIGHLQPLQDVVQACDDVLEQVHSMPLAKLITPVERLHGFVYEWQNGGWASKIHGSPVLYDRLTDMLISWRRLELSTWGKLFDMELKKCEDDANSWWFIAYQAVIAGPLEMAEAGSDLQHHAASLLKTLETYFSTAELGQFASRMSLLKQLQKQVSLLVEDWPVMSAINRAVQNFIAYYARFERSVQEAIKSGKAPIEKQMKDVLLVASWKDTNITALRESARKSHLKLFRVVKKFRDVLGQPMKSIIDTGLPDETIQNLANGQVALLTAEVDDKALAFCQQSISKWANDYKRVANARRTVEIMTKLGSSPSSSVDVASELDSFLSELETSAAQLRKETPPFLTEENTRLVKHLKTRKRKLFAGVLSDLREMGFHYNLGTDALAKQDSTAMILSKLEPYVAEGSASAEYYFHKLLDLMPRVRNASQTHSEDLTGAEISRSTGFVEGMLHVILAQRTTLATTYQRLDKLTSTVRQVESIAALDNNRLQKQSKTTNVSATATWATQIIDVAIQLVQIHAKFGAIDNSQISNKLKSWRAALETATDAKIENPLPQYLLSDADLNTERTIASCLDEIKQGMAELCNARPDLAFVFEQVQLWTSVDDQPVQIHDKTQSLEKHLLPAVKSLTDSMLVAVEQFNKAVAKIPTSTEESAWLTMSDEAMVASLKSLHLDKIQTTLGRALSILIQLNLEDGHVNQLAKSLMAASYPIVKQYSTICQHAVAAYGKLNHSTSHIAFSLSKHFVQLAGQGFCTPQEQSDEKAEGEGQMEGGTGLGQGEGAEDISKDIQPDEDLSELAQEKNQESKQEEIEDEKDAVDMADGELEGEMGSVAGEDDDEKGSQSGDEDEDDEMDEEAGDVDDLDPNTVDEKMWDGEKEDDAEKEQEGENKNGKQDKDEQTAANDKADKDKNQAEEEGGEGEQDAEEEEELGAEQDEDVQYDEPNRQDQNVEEQDALALPDDMDLDGKDEDDMSSIGDDDLDELSDVEEKDTDEKAEDKAEDSDMGSENGDAADTTAPADGQKEDEDATDKPEEDNAEGEADQEMAENPEEQPEEREDKEQPSFDQANPNTDNVAPSDVINGGQDQDANQTDDQDTSQDNTAQRESGEMGESAADQDTSTGDKGSIAKSQEQPAQSEGDDLQDSTVDQPFKALGDALEKWHRQQREIKQAQAEELQDVAEKNNDEMAPKEFQHLQNDEMAADTQAIGTTTEEESRPFDDTMAIDDENEDPESRVMPEEDGQAADDANDADKMDTSEPLEAQDKAEAQREEGRTGVSTRKGAYDREVTPPMDGADREDQDEEESVDETSVQLSSTYITEPTSDLREFDEAMKQWTDFQAKTNPLSLALTSQLRLILTPSQSTKLSGSYRTGKRLNIKRIIPYIASSYKRDKIWMRRAIPTKRSYQILLCVDDSKSMGESASGQLALESFVMVSRALTLLEVGQVGVLGFGGNTFMAHDFTEPFASHDAGAKVLQRFSFQQDHTDIRGLVRDTIARFRAARLQNPGRGGEDLWQLALILSDGLTPSQEHDEIRRLLREAMEERIMIVFIIMDDARSKNKPQSQPQQSGAVAQNKVSSGGVLNLRSVKWVKDELGNTVGIKTEAFLDTFPFQYYLIVHDLQDLPAALAGLLRSWFAEVNA
ncbi:ATPase [Apiospora marii]|uniref:ATPase n=1 Tax=Apiospora marii TaxID=335849 RepID=UPI003130B224